MHGRAALGSVLAILIALAVAGCGGDGSVAGSTTTSPAPDDSTFTLRPVLVATAPPCDRAAMPSSDQTACFDLGDQVLNMSHVVDAEAVEYEPFDCPEGEVVCVDGAGDATAAPRTAWRVTVTLSDEGLAALNTAAERCYLRVAPCPLGLVAMVLGDVVLATPQIHEPSFDLPVMQLAEELSESEARELASHFG